MDPSMILNILPLALLAIPLSIIAAPLELVGAYVGSGLVIYSTVLGGWMLPFLAPLLLLPCPSCQIPPFQWRY
jgi:hypothetical protein